MTDQEELIKQFDNMRDFMMKVLEENRQLTKKCKVYEASEKRFMETIKSQSDAYEETIKNAEETIRELERKLRRKQYLLNYKKENKEKISAQNKEYKEKNREKINNVGAEVVTCGCGKTHRKDNTHRHIASKFHQAWEKKQSESTPPDSIVFET